MRSLQAGSEVELQLQLGVVILAGGASSRMNVPKLLLPWNGRTVVRHLCEVWLSLGASRVLVVTGYWSEELVRELGAGGWKEEQVQWVRNPSPERGMFSSIQRGVNWEGWDGGLEWTHGAIVLGDQPHLKTSTLERLMVSSAAAPDRIVQPASGGRGRHPVLLPWPDWKALGRMEEGKGTLRDFLLAREERLWRVEMGSDDPGLDLDMDTPEDYRRALELGR